jgi:hypothetical protein
LEVTYENLPDYGFVSEKAFPKAKSDIKLNTAYMASVELGVKSFLINKMSVYTGIYIDYGLNDIRSKEDVSDNANLVVYQPQDPANFVYNTAFHSYSKQMKPFAIGVIARLTLAKKAWDKNFFKYREQ